MAGFKNHHVRAIVFATAAKIYEFLDILLYPHPKYIKKVASYPLSLHGLLLLIGHILQSLQPRCVHVLPLLIAPPLALLTIIYSGTVILIVRVRIRSVRGIFESAGHFVTEHLIMRGLTRGTNCGL